MNAPSSRPLADPHRLAALEASGLLDSEEDPAFRRLTRLASRLLDAPVALVSVLDERCQRFVGSAADSEPWKDLDGTPLSHSFCKHAVETGEPLVVEDAREHPLVRDNPAIEDLDVVAYAGLPLATSDGHVLGTVCVIDHRPRAWTDEELDLLGELAGLAVAHVELRAEAARRRRTQEELRERETRYRALVENLRDMITVLDDEATVLYESPSVRRILGYEPEELVGTDVMEWVHPDDLDGVGRTMEELLVRPGATRMGEVRFRHADGGWRPVEYVAQNLLEEPAVEGIVVVSRDVSERRALEERARQADRLDALGRLAGGVAHDFNNVLAAIQGSAGLALDVLDGDHPAREDVEEVAESAQRGARLTRQLLTFSRGRDVERRLLDPGRVVEEMTDVLRRLAGREVELRVEVGDDVPAVRAAPSEIEQVLLNLVVNARDAISGSGTIRVEVRGPAPLGADTVPVEQPEREAYAVLEVSDTGSGIPDEVRKRIFEPLFTTKGEGEGTGLGLSTVYGVVVRSGGRIGLRSEVGEGTTFSVYLPAAADGDEV